MLISSGKGGVLACTQSTGIGVKSGKLSSWRRTCAAQFTYFQ